MMLRLQLDHQVFLRQGKSAIPREAYPVRLRSNVILEEVHSLPDAEETCLWCVMKICPLDNLLEIDRLFNV